MAHDGEDGSAFMGAMPTTIAHYRVRSELGEGGMGAVNRAIDTKLDREVAISCLARRRSASRSLPASGLR